MRSADDRRTPAVIRDEALRLFADRGPDAVTLRDVARAAGVSAALVIHHFGSKAGLRRAVDDYVVAQIERVFDEREAVGDGAERAATSLAELVVSRLPQEPEVTGYLRRLLLSGDPGGMRVFAQWFEIVHRAIGDGPDPAAAEPDAVVRAAALLTNDLGRLLLRDHLTAVLGTDPLGRAGRTRWAAARP